MLLCLRRSAVDPAQHAFGSKGAAADGAINGTIGYVIAGYEHAVINLS